jgi:2-methylcitrate dehydratase PrpD
MTRDLTADLAADLIRFTCDLDLEQVPQTTRAVLLLSLLDWLAVGRAGVSEPVARIMHSGIDGGAGRATMFGTARKTTPRNAALANGSISHALDYDDTHFLHIGHPAVVVFPAALAVAQHTGATGRAFLAAALAGYETGCRVGHWLGRGHYRAGFHMTATAGCFGATFAAGKLLDLDAGQMRHAVGLAAGRAAGLKAQFGTMGKPANAGLAAANGVEAAMQAARGMTSDAAGLDSFATTHAGDFTDPAGLPDHGFVTADVSHKYHACCHGIHATLEALARTGPVAGEVKQVAVTVNPGWLNVCNKPAPATGLEAKFSYAQCVAMALAGLDTGALATYSDENCHDKTLTALRDLVHVAGDDTLADSAARVLVTCHDGLAREARFDLLAPVALPERQARIYRKVSVLAGPTRAAQLRDMVDTLDRAATVAPLARAVQGGG